MIGNLQRFHFNEFNSDTDNGIILTVTYVKEFSDTGLRITASGGHRNIYPGGNHLYTRW